MLDGGYSQRMQLVLMACLAMVACGPSRGWSAWEAVPSNAAAPIDFGRYQALIIGNSNYRYLGSLPSALKDAGDVAAVLREAYEFEDVRLLPDATREQIMNALDRYRVELSEEDNLLIYYAGHGWLDETTGVGYWQPVDAKPRWRANWIPTTDLKVQLRAIRAKHVLVVADSCYSGTLRSGAGPPDALTPTYLARMADKRGRQVITSGGLEPVADGGGGTNSIFARHFLRTLQENEGVLDAVAVFERVRRGVVESAEQTPQFAPISGTDHDGGTFMFVARGTATSAPTRPLPAASPAAPAKASSSPGTAAAAAPTTQPRAATKHTEEPNTERCRALRACTEHGLCVERDRKCVATEASCAASQRCRDFGECAAARGACVPTHAGCSESWVCKSFGHCAESDGKCVDKRHR